MTYHNKANVHFMTNLETSRVRENFLCKSSLADSNMDIFASFFAFLTI